MKKLRIITICYIALVSMAICLGISKHGFAVANGQSEFIIQRVEAGNWHYNLIPFNLVSADIMVPVKMILANIIAFVPIGFMLPITGIIDKLSECLILTFVVALGIELFQFFGITGYADTTDLITRLTGCALGWLIWFAISRMRKKQT